MLNRARIEITGIVQGVGFRPFIFGLADQYGLRGWVLNNGHGVLIEAEGEELQIEAFTKAIGQQSPPLSRIETLSTTFLPAQGYRAFEIRESVETEEKFTLISPDVSTCDSCLEELYSSQDRRYRYPFINCTHCGPRFTIIQDIPYDRPKTTMVHFKMCHTCQEEYGQPSNRRFHAQPNACPRCGPSLHLEDLCGKEMNRVDPIEGAIELLKEGKIVAVKGLGGFHLACDAKNEEAVETLRSRKYREDKPFAIMCRDIEEVRSHCRVSPYEEELLLAVERPIVILPRERNGKIARSVAPYQNTLGVMLPYTPLHHLLLSGPLKALVMTSGNISDEPIAFKNGQAKEKLSSIADYFLLHNREIYTRCDDSVLMAFQKKPIFFRRSRGYTPYPIKMPSSPGMILACGGELKNTFCLTKGHYAFMSHHIGDLENLETLNAFEEGIEHFKRIFQIKPEVLAYDLHPDYLSTKYALSQEGIVKIGIQHHHAHVAACMADNGIDGDVIGVAFDGTGYGSDGTLWGGEFLKASYEGFIRKGHLKPIQLPGGEKAIREPWRIVGAYLYRIFGDEFTYLDIPFNHRLSHEKWTILKKMLDHFINTPLSSSIGRLFDAVSSLLGIRDEVRYEGQAAIELEAIANGRGSMAYPFPILERDGISILDPDEMINGIVNDLMTGEASSSISTKFHKSIGNAILGMCRKIREEEGLNRVVLTGGVFQNRFLLKLAWRLLKDHDFEIYIHHQVPPNDGGLSLGQAMIAGRMMKKGLVLCA